MKSLKVNAALNVVKQLSSILFPLITIPYITRVLQAENYGKISFVSSVIAYFALFASLGIQTYAIRNGASMREDTKKLTRFASEAFTVNLGATILSYILLIVTIILVPKFHDYIPLFIIFSTSIICTTIGADWVNSIFEDFFVITVRTIAVQFVSLILMFLLVKTKEDYLVYAGIHVFAGSAAMLINAFYIRRYIHLRLVLISIKTAWNHIQNILIFFSRQIMISVYVSSDIIILGFLCGDTQVALYSIAMKIYSILSGLMYAVITVLMPRFANRIKSPKNLKVEGPHINQVFDIFIYLSIPLASLVAVTSYSIVRFISGPQFEMAYKPLIILMLAFLATVFSGLYSVSLILPLHEEKYGLYVAVIAAVLNVALNLIFIPHYGYIAAAITTVLAEMVCAILYWRKGRSYFHVSVHIHTVVSAIIESFIILVIAYIVSNFMNPGFFYIMIVSALSGLIYLGILYIFSRKFFMEFIVNDIFLKLKIKFKL